MTTRRRLDNFDALRLAAALAVFCSHQYKLTGLPDPAFSTYHGIGWAGVMVFFAISGYLVVQSWERDPHPWRFLARRALRIWPGLVCATLLAVFVLGPALTSLPLAQYFAASDTWRFVGHIALVISKTLPGVFAGNPMEKVNGPLWTIPVEVGWYVVLAALGMAGALRRRWALPAVLLACAGYVFGIYGAEDEAVPRFFAFEFGLFFLAGACLHQWRDLWQARPVRAGIAVGALAVLAYALGHEYIAIVIALPYAVVAFGSASTPVLRHAGRHGDWSYGLYIYSFPVQQTVVWCSGNTLGLLEGGVIAPAISLLLAAASWRWVERPALGLKDRLVSRPESPPRAQSGSAGLEHANVA